MDEQIIKLFREQLGPPSEGLLPDLFPTKKLQVRALSWKQPFGTLMLHGKIETRTWYTDYRGLVLICTSRSAYTNDELDMIAGEEQFPRIVKEIMDDPTLHAYGRAIAVGKLIGCRPMKAEDSDKCFVHYRPDLYAHVYDPVKRIEPFFWKGVQGWKEVSEEILRNIKFI